MKSVVEVRGPSREEIQTHLGTLGIRPSKAAEFAEMLVGDQMARRVGNSIANNTRVRYPSRKMRLAVICESYSIEYGFCCQLEYAPDVLWYSTQPCRMQVQITQKDGKVVPKNITPDFLVVTTDEMYFVETKPEEYIEPKAEVTPDWRREGDNWRYLPGEQNLYGIKYKVFTDRTISRHAIANFETLHATHLAGKEPDPDEMDRLHAVLSAEREITIERLQNEHEFEHRFICRALASGQVFWLPEKDRIVEPHRCRLFGTAERAAAAREAKPCEGIRLTVGNVLMLQDTPWRIMGLGSQMVSLQNEQGHLHEVRISEIPRSAVEVSQPSRSSLLEYRDKDVEEAVQKLQFIRLWSASKSGPPKDKRASFYRWKADYAWGEAEYGDGLLSLIPNRAEQGKRDPVHPEKVNKLMLRVLTDVHETSIAPSLKATHKELDRIIKNEAEYAGLMVPSYETLRRLQKSRSITEVTKGRRGRRAANQVAPTLAQKEGEKPIRGLFPWHIVECDHTPADIQLVDENGTPLTGETWLTVIVDTFSRMPLVWRLTVKGEGAEREAWSRETPWKADDVATPSAKRMASMLREMAYTHQQWPIRLHVDNGSDFRSGAVECVLANHGVIVSNRSPGNPRRGPTVESFNDSVNSGVFHQLAGNKKILRYYRSVTKTVAPSAHARYTLEQAHAMLDYWMIEVFPNSEHTGLQRKPVDAYREGMALSRDVIRVVNDDRLRFAMTTEIGTRKIVPSKGIHHHKNYWADQFDLGMFSGEEVPVRIDPWDNSFVWTKLGTKWVLAKSDDYATMSKLDEVERRIRSEEAHFARVSSDARKRKEYSSLPADVPQAVPAASPKAESAPSEPEATPASSPSSDGSTPGGKYASLFDEAA